MRHFSNQMQYTLHTHRKHLAVRFLFLPIFIKQGRITPQEDTYFEGPLSLFFYYLYFAFVDFKTLMV